MTGMRRLIAVAVVISGVAFPVCAQRGGGTGHGGGGAVSRGGSFVGHSGGFAVHSAPAFHSSAPTIGRGTYGGSPQVNGYYRYAAGSPNRLMPGRGPVAGYPGRSSYPDRRSGPPDRRYGYRDDDRYRRPYFGAYGIGFPSGFTVWPGSLLDSSLYDPDFYGNTGYDDSAYYGNQVAPADYPPPQYPAPADYAPAQYPAPPMEQAEAGLPGPYRPAYERPQPAPEPESAVMLVFKDGRPTEQIHNYMLTRTTLYVQDGSRREIPVDELDFAATQKANKDAGVDFQLPRAGR